VIKYRLIKPYKHGGIIGWLVKVYNTIVYLLAEREARIRKQETRKRHYLAQVGNRLYLYSRADHLDLLRLTGHGFDFLRRIKYLRFYTDDRKKK
jgi:hypothetical protein